MHPELSKRLVQLQLEEALAMEGLFGPRVVLEEIAYPHFFVRYTTGSGRVHLLRFDATDYDRQPLKVDPVHPDTRAKLLPQEWPLRGGGQFPGHPDNGNGPFLCIQGTRDFYTHPSHLPAVTGERWEKHRPTVRIRDLIHGIALRFARGDWT